MERIPRADMFVPRIKGETKLLETEEAPDLVNFDSRGELVFDALIFFGDACGAFDEESFPGGGSFFV
jgi:hypothetical protein